MSVAILSRKTKLLNVMSQINEIIRAEAATHQTFISNLNRDQLLSGINAAGKRTPLYAASSDKSGHIDLFDTGDFQRGIEPLFDDIGIDMISVDEKTEFLDPMYTALGLTKKSEELLRNKLRIGILRRIKIEILK